MTQQAGKCLIVEDDSRWQEILREVVEEGKCNVSVAPSLRSAHTLIEREFFHVVVVDLSLTSDDSDQSGLVILALLRDLGEGTQSILVTGHGTLALGFDVGSRFGGLGAIAKDDFAKQKGYFMNLLQKGLSAAQEEQARLFQEPRGAEVEILRGDRKVYLWEHEVTSAIGGGIQLIHTLLHLLLRPMAPLMPPRDANPSVIEADQHIIRSSLWSRAIGQAVNIVFGEKSAVEGVRATLPAGTQIVAESERLNLAGFAALDSTREFDCFKSVLKTATTQPSFEGSKRR